MRILVLEDSKPIQLLLNARLVKEGHNVEVVDNGHQGFLLASSNPYDVIISDVQMPHWDGFKFIEAIQVVSPRVPIIIVTSSSGHSDTVSRLRTYSNILEILAKPIDFKQLFILLGKIGVQAHDSLNKKARIVCTLGPASKTTEIHGQMMLAGMDVARLNFSHGTYEQHAETLIAVRKAEEKWGKPVAILQDLCGPKIRVGVIENDGVQVTVGDSITIQAESVVGNSTRISTISPEILSDLQVGDPVLLDDGLLEFKVLSEGSEEVRCEVVVGGLLKSNKGMNLPATALSLPSVTEKDWRDLDWGLEHSVDYVALSFVREACEIQAIKDYIRKSGKRDIKVIAKVEKPEAVKHIRDIIAISDAIMIARGDMGVELPAVRVPRIQQEIIRLCWEMNTPVITATQMLDSMTNNSRPTRAEVTDVSMAVRGGTDAVMLSQETATGCDPVNVVRTMASIIGEEELYSGLSVDQYEQLMNDSSTNPALTAVAGLNTITASMLLDPTGTLYPVLSKWSRKVPTLLVTKSVHVARHASLYNNIIPMIIKDHLETEAMIAKAMTIAQEWGYIRAGDLIAVVEGERLTDGGIEQIGSLQMVRVQEV